MLQAPHLHTLMNPGFGAFGVGFLGPAIAICSSSTFARAAASLSLDCEGSKKEHVGMNVTVTVFVFATASFRPFTYLFQLADETFDDAVVLDAFLLVLPVFAVCTHQLRAAFLELCRVVAVARSGWRPPPTRLGRGSLDSGHFLLQCLATARKRAKR